ncbi:MAG: recombination-associated protein RdgC [Deltaproteobacteria bacterium]|nr:recombination-associated protein RdgC [Deltaproteobacteria bacterium]
MSLLEGVISLTRYRVTSSPAELSEEFIAERIKRNAFVDIDNTADEESIGWVEVLDPFAASFEPYSFKFGEIIALGMRVDKRTVAPKVVNRYLALAEAELQKTSENRLRSEERRELKARQGVF